MESAYRGTTDLSNGIVIGEVQQFQSWSPSIFLSHLGSLHLCLILRESFDKHRLGFRNLFVKHVNSFILTCEHVGLEAAKGNPFRGSGMV